MATAGLLAAAVPFLLALLLTALVRRLAPRMGLLDEPGGRKAHAAPVPLGGGIAVVAALGLTWAALGSSSLDGDLAPLREGLALRARDLTWVLSGGLALFALGLVDDLRELGPRTKLAVQAAVAATVALMVPAARISVLSAVPALQVLLAMLWIVGLANAFNFLDNMDGLSAGVAAIAAALLAVIALTTGRLLMAGFFLSVLGALGGFLVFNVPPASVFLGDAGSLLVGYLMAVGSVLFTYTAEAGSLAPVGVPLLVFGVPLFDMVTVMGIRWREGRPLWTGDRRHFSHRLVALGMTPRQAVGTIWLLSFVMGLGALLLYHVPREGVLLLILQAAGAFAIVALLERASGRRG